MKPAIVFFFLFLCFSAYSQPDSLVESKRRWVSFENDNDFLALGKVTDRYYTFGMLMSYTVQSENTLQTVGVAMQGYTPTYINNTLPDSLTRPFAGWSYLFYNRYYSTEKLFVKTGIELGISGPKSGAGNFQNLFHELGGDVGGNPQVEGWDNQIPDKIGVNILLDVNYNLFSIEKSQFYLGVENSLGNVFTYTTPYFSYQYSLNDLGSYFPIKLSLKNKNKISYALELRCGVKIPLYTATLEGEYFSSAEYISKNELNKSLTYASLLTRISYKQWSLIYGNTYYSKEIKKNENHLYGTLGVNYAF